MEIKEKIELYAYGLSIAAEIESAKYKISVTGGEWIRVYNLITGNKETYTDGCPDCQLARAHKIRIVVYTYYESDEYKNYVAFQNKVQNQENKLQNIDLSNTDSAIDNLITELQPVNVKLHKSDKEFIKEKVKDNLKP